MWCIRPFPSQAQGKVLSAFPVSTRAAAAQLRETEARHYLKPGAISPGYMIASPASSHPCHPQLRPVWGKIHQGLIGALGLGRERGEAEVQWWCCVSARGTAVVGQGKGIVGRAGFSFKKCGSSLGPGLTGSLGAPRWQVHARLEHMH